MKEGKAVQQTARLLKLLAHPARLRILDELRRGEACVCHLQAVLGQRQPYISQQMQLLREAGVAESLRDGTFSYYRLANPRVALLLETMFEPSDPQTHPAGCACPACQ
jgi:DNA-binding transcriptional ArsR family regulator